MPRVIGEVNALARNAAVMTRPALASAKRGTIT